MKSSSISSALLPLLVPALFVAGSGPANAVSLTRDTSSAVLLTARLPSSAIHKKPLAASGGKFWIGRPTSHYCPPQVGQSCPKGRDTSILVSNEYATCSMNVVVPGGQQVYVAPDGSLSFTRPHSAYIPPGSNVTGFGLRGGELVTPSHRLVACPDAAASNVWQIFAPLEAKGPPSNPGRCVEFRAVTAPATDPVWEYI
ncbi:hypothetical protein E4U41_001529 [Claviceps citrina]|nr:hypothetical protein E4U41_001529 [Claviceps citrina]